MKKLLLKTALLLFATGIAYASTGPSGGLLRSPFSSGQENSARMKVHSSGGNLLKADMKPMKSNAGTVASNENLQRTDGNLPVLYGSVTYSAPDWNPMHPVALYAIDGTPAGFTKVADVNAEWGGAEYDGKYYCIYGKYDDEDNYYVCRDIFDTDNWSLLNHIEYSGDDFLQQRIKAFDMTIDPATGIAYGCFWNGNRWSRAFCAINLDTMERTQICEMNTVWPGIAFAPDGTLYAVDADGNLLNVDKATGATTTVGSLGFAPGTLYPGSLAIDQRNGRMFFTYTNNDTDKSFLYEIDKVTGATTQITQFTYSDMVVGMYVPVLEAAGDTPGFVTDLSVYFPEGNLSGTIGFRAPTVNHDGSTGSGSLTYTIKDGRTVLASGTTAYGEQVTENITFANSGVHELKISCSNDNGEGDVLKFEAFFGKDTPKMEAPTATYDYNTGKVTVSWNQPYETLNGGYCNVDELRYTVTMMPGNVTIADATPDCSVVYDLGIPSLDTYHFVVTADYNGLVSEPVQSNVLHIGSVGMPFTDNFDDASTADIYTMIDANNDGETWERTLDPNYEDHAYFWLRPNYQKDLDDWMILPPVRLSADKYYSFKLQARDYSSKAERFEVMAGQSCSAEGMDIRIIEPTDVGANRFTPYTGYFQVPADGLYYVGIHGISPKEQYVLYIDNIELQEVDAQQMPQPVDNLTVVAGDNYAFTATVSFNAPAKNVAGGDLESLAKIEIYRQGQVNEELLHTFINPTPGEALSWVHDPAIPYDNHYIVYAYTENGKSKAAEQRVWIGEPLPDFPEWVNILEDLETEGKVTVTWEPVTTTWDGQPIDQSIVKYNMRGVVGNGDIQDFLTMSPETSYTFQAIPEGQEQDFVQFQVQARTESGGSIWMDSEMIPVGKPYDAPFGESFAGGHAGHMFALRDVMGNARWGVFSDQGSLYSADGDNGFMAVYGGEKLGDAAGIRSAKISLKECNSPAIRFQAFKFIGDEGVEDTNTIDVNIFDGTQWTTVKTIVIKDLDCEPLTWGNVVVDLSAFTGKSIQFELVGTLNRFANILVDNIYVGTVKQHDIAVEKVTAPKAAELNEGFDVNVTVANRGISDTGSYTVDLLHNGATVATVEGPQILSGSKTVVNFTHLLDQTAGDVNTISAKVNYDADLEPGNDRGEEVSVALIKSEYPAVRDLSATADGTDVTLSWSEPSTAGLQISKRVLDDFESYESFSSNAGEWLFVDADGANIGGLQGLDLPNVPDNNEGAASMFIMDSSWADFNGNLTFSAYSGTKYLSNMFLWDDGAVDDWAISPELSGKLQNISFVARSYTDNYPETIQVLYSTTDRETSSFQMVEEMTLPGVWTPYTVVLPEGARYFAIRVVSVGAFMCHIDDVSYKVRDYDASLTLKGYHVWRDLVKLTDSPVAGTIYNDVAEPGDHTYNVVAVYEEGESHFSNNASVMLSGADAAVIEESIDLQGRTLVLTAPAGSDAAAFTADGKTVFSIVTGSTVTKTELAPGIYIVRLNGKTRKLIVR